MLAASLALVAFLGGTGYALDRAFVDTAQNALRERLADLANGYLSGSELDRSRAFISPEFPPDQRFLIPGSGLYASVRGEGLRWESAWPWAARCRRWPSSSPASAASRARCASSTRAAWRTRSTPIRSA